MTDLDILTNLPPDLPFPEASVRLLARDGVVLPLPAAYRFRQEDRVVLYTNRYGSTSIEDIPLSEFAAEFTTAEEWLSLHEYTPLRLVTLLDLESRLSAVGVSSPKMQAARSWINQLLAAFSNNPSPRNDWQSPPFTFSEVLTEAMQLLNTPAS